MLQTGAAKRKSLKIFSDNKTREQLSGRYATTRTTRSTNEFDGPNSPLPVILSFIKNIASEFQMRVKASIYFI